MSERFLHVAWLALLCGCSLSRGALGQPIDGARADAWVATDAGPDAVAPLDAGDAGLDGGNDGGNDAGDDAFVDMPDAWSPPDMGTDAFDYPDSGCGNPGTGHVTLTVSGLSDLRAGGQVTVDFTGMLGTGFDWIGMMPVCSATCCSGGDWVYTPWRVTAGTVTIPIPADRAPGGYVVRAYYNDTFTLEGESPVFLVAP